MVITRPRAPARGAQRSWLVAASIIATAREARSERSDLVTKAIGISHGVARVDDARSVLGDPRVIDGRVIGRDQDAVLLAERFGVERRRLEPLAAEQEPRHVRV